MKRGILLLSLFLISVLVISGCVEYSREKSLKVKDKVPSDYLKGEIFLELIDPIGNPPTNYLDS